MNVERSDDCRGRRAVGQAMIDGVDEDGDAEHVRHENEFLALVVAHLADAREEIDAGEPFAFRRFNFADEPVQVLDERGDDFAQPRVGRLVEAFGGQGGDVLFGRVSHEILRRQIILPSASDSMDKSIESEIDRIAQEIERLQKDGDPEGRIPDLNAYLRVLNTRLSMALQQEPRRWEPSDG